MQGQRSLVADGRLPEPLAVKANHGSKTSNSILTSNGATNGPQDCSPSAVDGRDIHLCIPTADGCLSPGDEPSWGNRTAGPPPACQGQQQLGVPATIQNTTQTVQPQASADLSGRGMSQGAAEDEGDDAGVSPAQAEGLDQATGLRRRGSNQRGPRKNSSHVSHLSGNKELLDGDTMSVSSLAISEGTSSITELDSLTNTYSAIGHSGAQATSGPNSVLQQQQRRLPDRHASMPAIPAQAGRGSGRHEPQRTASCSPTTTPPGGPGMTTVQLPNAPGALTSPKQSEGGADSSRKTAKAVPSRLSLAAGPHTSCSSSADPLRVSRTCDPSSDGQASVNTATGGGSLSSRNMLTTSSSLATLHKTVETIMMQDSDLQYKVQASMRGISSLAKETTNLEVGRDATGATCINQYVVVKTLGRGSFGKVKLCLNTLDGQLYAIKMVNRSFIAKQLQKPQKGLRRRVPTRNASNGLMSSSTGAGPSAPAGGELSRSAASSNVSGPLNSPPSLQPAPVDSTLSGSNGLPDPASVRRLLSGGQDNSMTSTAGVSSKLSTETSDNPFESVMREIAVLKKLDHPNVVKLHEVIDPPGAAYMMLVMEYMERGPVLETKTQGGFDSFPERIARDYFRQACAGLDYLHYNNVVHGDLKPENLLVTAAGQLKIGDFGSARILSDASASSKVSGTPAFQPPEAVTASGLEDPQAADVWALGVCLYCFVYGQLPFTGHSILDISQAIIHQQVQFPADVRVSKELYDLFDGILCKDPAKRLTLQQVMEHPWVTEQGGCPLVSLRLLANAPTRIEVSGNEALAAINRYNMVSMVRARLKEKTFAPGEVLFKEGEEAHCIYMIMSGVVEITSRLAAMGVDPSLLEEVDEMSFSVDLDESFTLDCSNITPADGEIDLHDGKLHIDRYKAQALKDRMRGLLLGRQAEYVTEVKGPGQVIGDVGLDKSQVARHKHSARARDHVVVVKLTEESFMKAIMQQQQEAAHENDTDLLTKMNAEDDSSGVPAAGISLTTIVDNDAADVGGF